MKLDKQPFQFQSGKVYLVCWCDAAQPSQAQCRPGQPGPAKLVPQANSKRATLQDEVQCSQEDTNRDQDIIKTRSLERTNPEQDQDFKKSKKRKNSKAEKVINVF